MDTMSLRVVDPSVETGEEAEETHRRRNWIGVPTREERRHRIHDKLARYKRDLDASQKLNESQAELLSAEIAANEGLRARVAELESQLELARSANTANAHAVTFDFPQRPVDGPEDQATTPVSHEEIRRELQLPPLEPEPDAALKLLERLAESASTQTRVTGTWVTTEPDEDGEDEDLLDETPANWVAQPSPRVTTWGRPTQTLEARMSGTGTYQVVASKLRDTGPSAIPGVA